MDSVQLPKTPVHCRNFIAGAWQEAAACDSLKVLSPYTGGVIGRVPLSGKTEVDQAVAGALTAFSQWRGTPIKERTGRLFNFRNLLQQNLDLIAHTAASESGKTVEEGRAGVLKGIEVIEFALSLQNMDHGGAMAVSRGVSCEIHREPLGVVAGITPFNFPAMVPLWLYPIAITLGNCFILKPSEKVPLTSQHMGQFMQDAGYPPGVFSVLNGDKQCAELLASHPDIRALAFVGSTAAASSLYTRATASGKRALCLGGAKNQLIVVPDADPGVTPDGVLSSFTGCAGQRCMAASVMMAVGDTGDLIGRLVESASRMRLGQDIGAIVSASAKERICSAIENAARDGARLLLDGRKTQPPEGYENGYWLGPTIMDDVRPEMECARQEIFGPVLCIIRTKTLAQAMELEARNQYGNATSVFTTSGAVARFVSEHATSGMVGINVGVPVPREPFSFGGTKASKFGHGDITGESVLDFWSNRKKITTKWTVQQDMTWMS